MIPMLYPPFQKWAEGGSIYILSDLHFDDSDCKLMAADWIRPEEQIKIINKTVMKNDTFVCLGDVGEASYIEQIHAKRKILQKIKTVPSPLLLRKAVRLLQS